MRHRKVFFSMSLVFLLSTLAFVTVDVSQTASGSDGLLNTPNFLGTKDITLNQSGTVHIVIDDPNITNITLVVLDQANHDLQTKNSAYSNISALTVTNVSSVDVEADLPAGTYYAEITGTMDSNITPDALVNEVDSGITVTYPSSQPLTWALIALNAAAVVVMMGFVYMMIRRR